jgi:transmembrane sensor
MQDEESKNHFENILKLISDDRFIRYVKYQKHEDVIYWEKWLRDHPYKRENVEEAKKLVNSIDTVEYLTQHRSTELSWAAISEKYEIIKSKEKSDLRARKTKYFLMLTLVLLIIMGICFGIYIIDNQKDEIKYETFEGQIASILLPDSTLITLSEKTKVSISHDNYFNKYRKVKIEGEAFFDVKAKNILGRKQDFIVSTNTFNIKVLGTSFNVKEDNGYSEVYLQSGSILLNEKMKNLSLQLEPNDFVLFNHKNKKFTKTKTESTFITAWKTKELKLEKTSLLEILNYMAKRKKKNLVLQSKNINSKFFSGTLPFDDSIITQKTLEEAFDINIIEAEDKIIVKSK